MSYTSNEIQDISSEFRNAARRLSRTDYSQCDSNSKRFMSMISANKIIENYITEKNTHIYDIEAVIKARSNLGPFEVSPDVCEEISFEYQLLTYALENYDGDFTRLYGTHRYTSYKSTMNDEMRKFIEHIIDPFIDYISEHLRRCYEKVLKEEEKANLAAHGGITANYSTVVLGSNVGGNISTQVTVSESTKTDAIELISEIKESLQENNVTEKEEIVAILKHIEEDSRTNIPPKKGFLSALRALCAGSALVISLVTALIKLFSA